MKINIFKHMHCYSEQTVYTENYLCKRLFLNCVFFMKKAVFSLQKARLAGEKGLAGLWT